VWQSSAIADRGEVAARLTSAVSNDCGAGGSIAGDRRPHAIAKAAPAPPTKQRRNDATDNS